jgi:predicted ATP-dependent endonuclease of OLD family
VAIKFKIKNGFNSKTANVVEIIFEDTNEGICFNFDFLNRNLLIKKVRGYYEPLYKETEAIENIEKEIDSLNTQFKELELSKVSNEYINYLSELDKLKNKRDLLYNLTYSKNIIKEFQISGSFEKENNETPFALFHYEKINREALLNIVEEIVKQKKIEFKDYSENENSDILSIEYINLQAFNEYDLVEFEFFSIINSISEYQLSYLNAKNDYLQVINLNDGEFNSLSSICSAWVEKDIKQGETEHLFVKMWMQKFEIGIDFNIVNYESEAFELNIINQLNQQQPLSDLGKGSIKLIKILLFIGVQIKNLRNYNKYKKLNIIIIIEEPELNLHPALQSLLADLLLEVHLKNGIDFLIETHSEYFVRKTQLLVKEKEFEIAPNENPFSVIYFDENKGPYKMNYREDGKFIEDFGKGFYDESSLLTLNLL